MKDAIRGTLLVIALAFGLSGGVWAATGSERAGGTTLLISPYLFIPLADRILYPKDKWRGTYDVGQLK